MAPENAETSWSSENISYMNDKVQHIIDKIDPDVTACMLCQKNFNRKDGIFAKSSSGEIVNGRARFSEGEPCNICDNCLSITLKKMSENGK